MDASAVVPLGLTCVVVVAVPAAGLDPERCAIQVAQATHRLEPTTSTDGAPA